RPWRRSQRTHERGRGGALASPRAKRRKRPPSTFAQYSPMRITVLTRRQKDVLDFVTRQIDRTGVAPTLHEIGRHLKLSSVATVPKHLRRLEEKGAIRRLTHQSRALAVVPPPERAGGARVPLLGAVAAGTPIEPIEVPGTITIPEELLGRGE